MPGFPENVTSPEGRISGVQYSVRGVLYADGSSRGEDGSLAKEKFMAQMKYWLDVFQRFQAGASSYSDQDLENKIKAGYFPTDDGPLANEGLRRIFTSKSTGKLVPPYREKIALVVSRVTSEFAP